MAMDSPTLLAITDKPGLAVSYTEALWSDMSDITLDITTVRSDNDTGSEWTSLDTAEQIFEGAILCLMIALTTLGNSLVVLAVCLEKKLRTFENFFFASLAIADLSIAMLVLPLSVRVELSGGKWDLGPRVCDLFIFTDVACCTASILHLCTIGINRCRSITSPLHYVRKQTFRRAAVMIVLVWIASFLIACPPLIGWPHSRNRSAQLCEYDVDKLYVVYSSCGSFFIPLLVMVIVYTRIYQVSRRGAEFRRNSAPQLNDHHQQNQQKINNQSLYQTRTHYDQVHSCPPSRRRPDLYRMEHNSRCTGRANSTVAASAEVACTGYSKPEDVQVTKPVLRRVRTSIFTFHPQGRCDNKKRFTEVKTVKTLGIIMGAFVVCWLPFFLLYVIKPFCLNCQIPKSLDRFVLWLGYLNSLLNPIIYICCKPLFRVTFKRILLFKYCRRQGEWKLGKPVQRGILVNCHKHRPTSSSDGPSAGRRKRPGRVMFADCPPGELYNEKEQSLSRTPTLPPERDSDGVVTYRNLPSRDCERQNIGRESYDHQLFNANSNNNCLYMRNNGIKGNGGKFLAGASIPHHFRRGDLDQSSSGSANDVSGSKLCCAGSRSRSSDNLEAMRSGMSQSRSQVVEVEIAREAKDHCSGTEHCPYTNEVFSTRTTETHSESMNRDEIEDGDMRGVRTDPTGHEALVETQDKSKESVSSGSDLNIFREVLV